MKDQHLHEFTYGKAEYTLLLPQLCILAILGPLLLFLLSVNIFWVIDELLHEHIISLEKALIEIPLICFGLYVIYMIPTFANQYSRIQITDNGIKVRIFSFRFYWKLIPWDQIIRVELTPNLDRWKQQIWVIKVKELSNWHKNLSRYYRMGPNPIVILTSDLDNRQFLLEIIYNRVGGKLFTNGLETHILHQK